MLRNFIISHVVLSGIGISQMVVTVATLVAILQYNQSVNGMNK